ncbi:hypothetical protein HNP33_002583 [Comamonas odontotermitis]|uniref:Uncharacterized protein n=1 Tax=Comamonas odontotermitis TaxID=379895 RepID=A0ABR6RH59_9BURK|nr:hypothetical protein [Comamonas odontotermitis]MBB6578501.1 hypothetical protein [Comamonas odontotermitis]
MQKKTKDSSSTPRWVIFKVILPVPQIEKPALGGFGRKKTASGAAGALFLRPAGPFIEEACDLCDLTNSYLFTSFMAVKH